MARKIPNKTPAGAAKALYRFICSEARRLGMDPEIECAIWNPEENRRRTGWGGWHVVWESGPFEWAVYLSGGSSLYTGEGYGSGPPQIDLESRHWYVEPGWSFSLCFHAR